MVWQISGQTSKIIFIPVDFVPGPWRVFYFYIVWSLKAVLASLLSNNWALLTLISLMAIKFNNKECHDLVFNEELQELKQLYCTK